MSGKKVLREAGAAKVKIVRNAKKPSTKNITRPYPIDDLLLSPPKKNIIRPSGIKKK